MKTLSLMNFADSYAVAVRGLLFQDEINRIVQTSGSKIPDALFIPYAFKGTAYTAYFNEISRVFSNAGMRIIDITSGDPASLISAANAIVVGGGDISAFINRMNGLITPAFNPYQAIKNKVDAGTPYIGWNEGSAVASPKYFSPPSNPLPNGTNASPFQLVCHYQDTVQNRASILAFLNNHAGIKKVIAQVDRPDGSSVRLEDPGAGMIDSATEPFPAVIRFEMINGTLSAS